MSRAEGPKALGSRMRVKMKVNKRGRDSLGVITVAEPLVISPRLVRVVKGSGLVCVSYGVLNNDPDSVQLQVREGIDTVIVDSVLAIREGLTGFLSLLLLSRRIE